MLDPRGPTLDFVRRDSESFGTLTWFQDSWRDSRDSCLPNKEKIYHVISNIRKLPNKNSKMLKFTDNLAICISWDSCNSKIPDKIQDS